MMNSTKSAPAITVLAAILIAAVAGAQSGEIKIPDPDLGSMEGPVRDRIEGMQGSLAEALSRGDVDPRVLDQRLTDLQGAACQEIEHAGRHARSFDQLGDHEIDQWSPRRWLDHHGATRSQRGP